MAPLATASLLPGYLPRSECYAPVTDVRKSSNRNISIFIKILIENAIRLLLGFRFN